MCWTVRGSNPVEGEISHACPDRPWGPPCLLYNAYRFFTGGKKRPGSDGEPSPLLMSWSRKSRAILLLPLWALYRPYGLYRASVPLQRCTLPLPIPLLPLWTVQPVQSLSACTTVHFTFNYTCTPPMGRTACTEPQCLYNGALYLYL